MKICGASFQDLRRGDTPALKEGGLSAAHLMPLPVMPLMDRDLVFLRQGPRGRRGPTPGCSGPCGKFSVYMSQSAGLEEDSTEATEYSFSVIEALSIHYLFFFFIKHTIRSLVSQTPRHTCKSFHSTTRCRFLQYGPYPTSGSPRQLARSPCSHLASDEHDCTSRIQDARDYRSLTPESGDGQLDSRPHISSVCIQSLVRFAVCSVACSQNLV